MSVILALGHTLHLVLGIAWSHKRMLGCQKTNLIDLGMSGSRGSMPGLCVHTQVGSVCLETWGRGPAYAPPDWPWSQSFFGL